MRLWSLFVWWLALTGIYCLLVSPLTIAEIAAGFAAALVATFALTIVRLETHARFPWKIAWLKPLAKVPPNVLRDCGIVLAAICERPFLTRGPGRFGEREFKPGNHQALSQTRRALVMAAISMAPNSFVVALDRAGRRLLVHELVPPKQSPREDDWPL